MDRPEDIESEPGVSGLESERRRSLVPLGALMHPQPTTYTSLPGSQEAMAHYLNTESLLDDRHETQRWDERPAEDAVMREHAG